MSVPTCIASICAQRQPETYPLQGVAANCGAGDISRTAPEHTSFADVLNSPCSTDITVTVEAITSSQGQGEGATDVRLHELPLR